MQASFEEIMKQAKAGELVSEPAATNRMEMIAGDLREVIDDVVLQHKQALLEEWESAERMRDMQVETWVGGCTICRIRGGQHLEHNWRRWQLLLASRLVWR